MKLHVVRAVVPVVMAVDTLTFIGNLNHFIGVDYLFGERCQVTFIYAQPLVTFHRGHDDAV